jgi:hypothetical protein
MMNSLPSIQAILSTTAIRWLKLTETLPSDLLTRAPAVNEWSALDCLQHLHDTERLVFPMRVQALLNGQDFAAFDPDTEGTKDSIWTPAQLAADFARLRRQNLTILEHIGLPDLARTGHHSELGLVPLGELLYEWAAHDLNHTIQAERALMQPFIAGSGPWRPYFQDNDEEVRRYAN